MGALLLGELLANISLLVVRVYLVALFFQKRRQFPRWFIVAMVAGLIVTVVDHAAVLLVGIQSTKGDTTIIRALVGCAIWIPYMMVSRRVKATFVR